MLYNQERKEAYLAFLDGKNIEALMRNNKNIFENTSTVEENWEKDVCDFTLAEIQQLLPYFNASSDSALRRIISILKTYTDWCCVNRLSIDNINHYIELNTSIGQLDKYLNPVSSKYMTREELLNICQKFYNNSDRFIVLALFEGVRDADLSSLMYITIQDIDKENLTITFKSGVKKNISYTLYTYAVSSHAETEYISADTMYASNLTKDDRIIHSRTNTKSDAEKLLERRLFVRLQKLRDFYNAPFLTASKLRASGICNEIYGVMEKHNISQEEFFGEKYQMYVREINSNYNVQNEPKWTLKMKFK